MYKQQTREEELQVDPVTGLSHDYLGQYTALATLLQLDPKKARDFLRENPIKRYSDLFPNTVVPQNRCRIGVLNMIAEEANKGYVDLKTIGLVTGLIDPSRAVQEIESYVQKFMQEYRIIDEDQRRKLIPTNLPTLHPRDFSKSSSMGAE